jgi:carboxylesterase type B
MTNAKMYTISMVHLLLLGLLPAYSLAKCNDAPTATIDSGVIVGKTTALPAALGPVSQFLGIPFAKSPPERFSPAQPPSRFREPLNVTEWKPACIQQFRCTVTRTSGWNDTD